MKVKNKKMIVGFVLMLAVLCSSITVFASSCLSVRDYGRHKYDHRVDHVEESVEVMGFTVDGRMHLVVTEVKYGWCVCGLYGSETRVYDRYENLDL